jgi:arsenate reductase-like glutaredoxin family protein
VLDKSKADVRDERPSRSRPLSDADAKALLSGVDTVTLARGKSARTLSAREVSLDDLRGPTGNFRAPIVRAGRRLLVGWNEESLRDLLARSSR